MKNLSSVDLNLLVAFDALMTEQNVTRAAERIGMSQPALSKALNRLRHLFDDTLFVRGPGGMEATQRARELAEPVRRALDEIRGTLAPRTEFDPARAEAVVTIGSVDFFDLVLLPPLMRLIEREAPGLELRTVTADRLGVVRQFAEGEIDFAFMPMGPPVTDLYGDPLFTERAVTLLRSGHPLAAAMTLEGFAAARHVKVAIEGRGIAWIDSMLAARGLQRRVVLSLPNFLTVPFVVGATDLISTLPGRLARQLAPLAGIVTVPAPLPAPEVTVQIMWHRRVHDSPLHSWLRRRIKEMASGL